MTISKRNIFSIILALGMAVAFAVAVIVQATSTIGLNIAVEDTRETANTGSYQTLAGDLTYEGSAGGTSTYHAGVMGNFLGDNLTNTTSSLHAGVIGSYNVTTDDDNTGGSAGVIGEVGDLADTAAYGVLSVLGGDGGALTPRAAYGVQYFNSTAGSKFDYGLDLFHAATADYGAPSAVDFGTADIRLQNGETISNGTDGTVAVGGAGTTLDVGSASIRTGTAVPTACATGDIFIDTDSTDSTATLYLCDSDEDGDGEFDVVTVTD